MPHLKSPLVRRAYKCQCGRPVFLRNTQCVHCGSQLGYDPVRLTMVALTPGPAPALWSVVGDPAATLFRFCVHRQSASACNWLVTSTEPRDQLGHLETPCLACRLNRRMFDVDTPLNRHRWRELETAKRRLLTQLLALRLPVEARTPEAPGIAFDMLEQVPGGPPVMTGHFDGIVTLNVAEADDAQREAIRTAMGEPYRTLLGHFRHEIGHYYWDRLVRDEPLRLEHFRALFGDERMDYAQALEQYYRDGPPPAWGATYLSSYASAHPWEDWAETWAHYLHIADTVDTAASFGIALDEDATESDPLDGNYLWRRDVAGAAGFLEMLNAWIQLTQVMNELSRSMGQPDAYPFVLPFRAVAKLQFIHEIVLAQRGGRPPFTG